MLIGSSLGGIITSNSPPEVILPDAPVITEILLATYGYTVLWLPGVPGQTWTLKRSAVSGGPYTTTITSTAGGTGYTDDTAGTDLFFYILSTTIDGIESDYSDEFVSPIILTNQYCVGSGATIMIPAIEGISWTCTELPTNWQAQRNTDSFWMTPISFEVDTGYLYLTYPSVVKMSEPRPNWRIIGAVPISPTIGYPVSGPIDS